MGRRRQGLFHRDHSRHHAGSGMLRPGASGWAIVEGLEARELLTLAVPLTTIPVVASAGLPFTGVVVNFTDSDPLTKPSDFTATISWGDGHVSAGRITNSVGGGFSVIGTNTYATSNQTFPVQVTVARPAAGQVGVANGSATVSDASLAITNPTPTTGVIGQPLQVFATLTDGNLSATPADYAITINWGDGTVTAPSSVTFGTPVAGGTTVSFTVIGTHIYTQSGAELVAITATRIADQRVVTGTATVTVASNASLSPIPTTITPLAGVPFTNLVVGSFTASPPNQGGFVATIDWGDGQSSVGTVVPRVGAVGLFDVLGSHTYGATTPAGATFPVIVTVTEPSVVTPGQPGGLSIMIQSKAVVVARGFVGGLDPLYDTGASNGDGITRINQPKFSGSAQPFAQIQLYTQLPQQSSPIFLSGTIASADGSWSVFAPGPLADGVYSVTAVVTPPSGSPLTSVALPSITIDTVSPVLTGVSGGLSAGQITVIYRDNASGISPAALSNPALYTLIFGPLSRRQAASVSPRPATAFSLPTDPQGALVTLGLTAQQRRALRGLRIVSKGVTDLAGNPLAGGNITILFKGHAGRTAKIIHTAAHPKASLKR